MSMVIGVRLFGRPGEIYSRVSIPRDSQRLSNRLPTSTPGGIKAPGTKRYVRSGLEAAEWQASRAMCTGTRDTVFRGEIWCFMVLRDCFVVRTTTAGETCDVCRCEREL